MNEFPCELTSVLLSHAFGPVHGWIWQAVVINANSWTNAGAAVNQVYDLLYMMGREDVLVGVGGEGSIQPDGTIEPDVGGYLPIVDQVSTSNRSQRMLQV